MPAVGQIAAVVAAVGALGFGAVVVGWRTRSRLLFGPLIAFQRAVINPRQLRSAGGPDAHTSIIRHVGRVSGRLYETPVDAVATADGFVIGLMYGPGSSWLRNVLASGSATIVHAGQTCAVGRPEVVPMRTVAPQFATGDQRAFRLLGVDQAVRLHRIDRPSAQRGIAR